MVAHLTAKECRDAPATIGLVFHYFYIDDGINAINSK